MNILCCLESKLEVMGSEETVEEILSSRYVLDDWLNKLWECCVVPLIANVGAEFVVESMDLGKVKELLGVILSVSNTILKLWSPYVNLSHAVWFVMIFDDLKITEREGHVTFRVSCHYIELPMVIISNLVTL